MPYPLRTFLYENLFLFFDFLPPPGIIEPCLLLIDLELGKVDLDGGYLLETDGFKEVVGLICVFRFDTVVGLVCIVRFDSVIREGWVVTLDGAVTLVVTVCVVLYCGNNFT